MTSVSGLTSSEAEVVAKLFLQGRLDSKKSLNELVCESQQVLELPAEFLYDFRKFHGTVAESEFKKLRICASALSPSETDTGSTTASYSSDEELSDHPETWSQNSSSTCTPRKPGDEISDQSCFENTDDEMDNGKRWKKQTCKYASFEPSQYVSSEMMDLLKTSYPRSPKHGSGWRPRSAGSVPCAGSTRPRPMSAPCRTRPTSSGNSTVSGTHPQDRVRPASATLGSLSKSWKDNPCSCESSKVVARKGEGRPRSAGSLASKVVVGKGEGRPRSAGSPVPATFSRVPEEKIKFPFRCVEWRSLAMPIWKKQRN